MTRIFLIMLGVDVCIGPLLTLIVYRPGKLTLRLDLGIIIALQLAAFAYGLWTVAEGRPAWLVFNADRFDIVRVNEIDTRELSKAKPEYRNSPWFGPRWVAALRPADTETRNTVLFESIFTGVDIAQRPQLYRPLTDSADAIRQRAMALKALKANNPSARVERVLVRYPEADAWLPLMAKARPMVVLLNKPHAEPLAIVDLRPWRE